MTNKGVEKLLPVPQPSTDGILPLSMLQAWLSGCLLVPNICKVPATREYGTEPYVMIVYRSRGNECTEIALGCKPQLNFSVKRKHLSECRVAKHP